MQQIIYVSEQAVPFGAADFKRLLAGSRLRNHEAGLSGLLIYSEERFLQVLEGPDDPLQSTLSRIQRDPRHTNIHILRHDEHLTSRMFGQWSMGYPDPTNTARILRGFISLRTTSDLSTLTNDQALELLLACASAGNVEKAA